MPFILGANSASDTVYSIDQSIRFNEDEDGRMGRTPSATGTEETWTWSFWVKRGNLGLTLAILFQIGADKNNCDQFYFNSSDQLVYQHLDSGSNTDSLTTTQVFRDTSAWYHIVLTADTTNTVESERIRIYVNGARVTDFSGTPNYPTQNTPTDVNTQVLHQIGAQLSATFYAFDGYMAEIVLLDGTSTDCTSFGEFNSSGIWIPKDVSGLTFGTNGFHIKGETANDLGNDSNGSNNFSTSGLDEYDQVPDSPTNNFCVLSRINMGSATGVALRDGNLDGRTSGTAGNGPASISLDSGKWYYELNCHAGGSGINGGAGETPTGSFHHFTLGSNGNQINTNGEDRAFSTSDIVGFKLDIDGGTLEYTTDGSSYSTVEGTLTANTAYAPYMRLGATSGRGVMNFGQDSSFGGLETSGSANASDDNGIGDFYYSVPSGFLAICTKNLGAD